MNEFSLWLTMGLEHILDLDGYDHICYIVALSIMFSWKDWRGLLLQVTAFTLGHSLSLALSVLNVLQFPQPWIEILIPITILITCLNNLRANVRENSFFQKTNFTMALSFGLIHGLGFSYLLKMMLGKNENVLFPLFSFNVGLEIGQLIIVSIVLLLTFLSTYFFKIEKKYWQTGISTIVACVAVFLLLK
jgi:HupE / UreJ protein